MFRILSLSLGLLALAAAGEIWASFSPALPGHAPLGAAQAQETAKAETPSVAPFSIGDPDAPVKMQEFASFTCGHCAHFEEEVFKKLKADYIDTGKVYFTYNEIYWDPYAIWAGMLARCGGEMRYFGIVEMIYEKQREWIEPKDPAKTAENLRQIGRTAGLDDAQMEQCLSDAAMVTALRENSDRISNEYGIEGTPTLMIDGKIYKNMGYDELKKILDDKLAG
jgi:protein-disulfide isomerase